MTLRSNAADRTIRIDGFDIIIHRSALVATELGVAGYVEARMPNGQEVRFAGRWDDALRGGEDVRPHIGESVWVDGEYVESNGEENGHLFDDDITTEALAMAILEVSHG